MISGPINPTNLRGAAPSDVEVTAMRQIFKRDVEDELRSDPDIDATDIAIGEKWRRDFDRLRS